MADALPVLREAIYRIVAEVQARGGTLRAGYHAGMLGAEHPEFSVGRILDELVTEAAHQGVPVEIGRK